MAKVNILEQFSQKKPDIQSIVESLIKRPGDIAEVVEALTVEKRAVKFAYEKTLRLVSERRPELIYPYFEVFVGLLDSENSFLKWGAIMTIGNLAAVDSDNRFEVVFKKYYAPISGPTMVTAANIIGSSAKIALAKPELTRSITKEMLKVEKARYQRHGKLSPECRNVALGHAVDSFEKFFGQIEDKAAVIAFVKRQLKTRENKSQKRPRDLFENMRTKR